MDNEKHSASTITVEKPPQKSRKDLSGIFGGGLISAVLFFGAYQVYDKLFEFPIGQILVYILGFLTLVSFMVTISCFFDYKESKKLEKMEEDTRREEQEFSDIDPSKRDIRAEKLFRMNQKQLMRYYDMNLSQTKFLSILGIIMILFGISIVGISLYMYICENTDKLLLLMGSLSGIVVDFIGAIFIKMYTENIRAAVKFHAKFAESNNLLLANSIANKIENEQLREITLSDISKNIIISNKKTSEP